MKIIILTIGFFIAIIQHWETDGTYISSIQSDNFQSVEECGLYLGKLNLDETRPDTAHAAWTAQLQWFEYDIEPDGKIKTAKIYNFTDSLSVFMDDRGLYKPWKKSK